MSTRHCAASALRMTLGGVLVATAVVTMATAPAAAHGRGRVFFGFGFGAPAYYPYYYPPYYYYPPPVYAPVPAYGTVQPLPAPPAPATAQDSSGQTCREYQTTVQVNRQWQPAYGTACLQPDGTWRVVK